MAEALSRVVPDSNRRVILGIRHLPDYFDFWRPWKVFHGALEDGNGATAPDATWAVLLTAPYPDWPSGHNCLDGAHVAVCGCSSATRFKVASRSRAPS